MQPRLEQTVIYMLFGYLLHFRFLTRYLRNIKALLVIVLQLNMKSLLNNLKIVVAPRDHVRKRLQNVFATVAINENDLFNNDVGSKHYCGYVDGVLNQYDTMINCQNSILGRFVQILMKVTKGILNIYEVEVYGI